MRLPFHVLWLFFNSTLTLSLSLSLSVSLNVSYLTIFPVFFEEKRFLADSLCFVVQPCHRERCEHVFDGK
jgi:hypothetical protein